MLEFVISLLMIPAVQTALIVVLLGVIGWAIKRWSWTRHVTGLALEAYDYAEEQGLVQNLSGYEKFDPFMDKFSKRFKAEYGKTPKPKDRAKAVEVMEKTVKKKKQSP